jgi:hypothetical protein
MKFLAIAIKHLIEHGADPLAIQRFVDEMAREGGSGVPPTDYRTYERERKRAYREELSRTVPDSGDIKESTPIPPKENNINIYTPMKAKKGSRLPEGWQPSLETLSYADKLGCSAAEIASMAEDFRLWAYSASGQVSIKRDWESAFKGWMRREKAKGKVSDGFKPKHRYGQVVQGSFRKEFKHEPEGPKVSEEERQANLAKLDGLLKAKRV